MVRVELRKDLNTVVARMVRDRVARLTREVADEAARRAPAAKVWVTMLDERVRPSHRDAEGQAVPENLRFKLRKQRTLPGGVDPMSGRRYGGMTVLVEGYDLAREPRDQNLPKNQKDGCRCNSVVIPKMIASKIKAEPVVVTARRARGRVSVEFNRIKESEFGTSGDRAARFMGSAVDIVGARLRASSRRT